MKRIFSIFIVNPATGEFVSVEDWRNSENPTSAEFVAIKRTDETGFILAKQAVREGGEVNFNWNKAVELAKAFKAKNDIVNLGFDGFRLPDRRECLDIYDARFQGLDEALAIIGGDPLDSGDTRWMWTEDEDPYPEYSSNYAFFFRGNDGTVNNYYKYYSHTVRPVSAFLTF